MIANQCIKSEEGDTAFVTVAVSRQIGSVLGRVATNKILSIDGIFINTLRYSCGNICNQFCTAAAWIIQQVGIR